MPFLRVTSSSTISALISFSSLAVSHKPSLEVVVQTAPVTGPSWSPHHASPVLT